MKTKLLIAGLFIMLGTFSLKAQFVVTDPLNIAQSIVNTANEVIQTSNTVKQNNPFRQNLSGQFRITPFQL